MRQALKAELDAAQDEVALLLSSLIRINTSNPTHVERPAAEWVAARLADDGVDTEIVEAAPGRASVLGRVEGRDPRLAPLLVHAHLDTVPADAQEWSVDPFSGEIRDGYVWGRGAVDMKHMVAMVLAVVRLWSRTGVQPERDLVLAFVADEEAGGVAGARYLVANRRDYFADCGAAIGEVGGFSITLHDAARLYLIQTAEKGLHWLRLAAAGSGGHGSLIHADTPTTRVAAAVARIADHRFPVVLDESMRTFVRTVDDLTGTTFDEERPDEWLQQLGAISRMIGAALRQTANPTWLAAGETVNVVPARAAAGIDARFLPGGEEDLLASLRDLAGENMSLETILRADACSAPYATSLVDSMVAALQAEDPTAHTTPFMLSAGTDAKAFASLGLPCYGFAPLRLPADLDFASMFHARDERVPVDGLQFGVRVLHTFLMSC